jgi:hypothetical protein
MERVEGNAMTDLKQAIQLANEADDRFSEAVRLAGFNSRWDDGVIKSYDQDLHDARMAKYAADAEVHRLFCEAWAREE